VKIRFMVMMIVFICVSKLGHAASPLQIDACNKAQEQLLFAHEYLKLTSEAKSSFDLVRWSRITQNYLDEAGRLMKECEAEKRSAEKEIRTLKTTIENIDTLYQSAYKQKH